MHEIESLDADCASNVRVVLVLCIEPELPPVSGRRLDLPIVDLRIPGVEIGPDPYENDIRIVREPFKLPEIDLGGGDADSNSSMADQLSGP